MNKPVAAHSMPIPARLGTKSSLNHIKLTPDTISSNCSKVATHDIRAAPAFTLAVASLERTCMPRLAIVAVLETKPEARADKISALSFDKIRFATCAIDCTIRIKTSNFKMTYGFSTEPHRGLFGMIGKAIKMRASKRSPSRSS